MNNITKVYIYVIQGSHLLSRNREFFSESSQSQASTSTATPSTHEKQGKLVLLSTFEISQFRLCHVT